MRAIVDHLHEHPDTDDDGIPALHPLRDLARLHPDCQGAEPTRAQTESVRRAIIRADELGLVEAYHSTHRVHNRQMADVPCHAGSEWGCTRCHHGHEPDNGYHRDVEVSVGGYDRRMLSARRPLTDDERDRDAERDRDRRARLAAFEGSRIPT